MVSTTQGLGTGLEYIRGKDRVIFSNGVVCSTLEFDENYANKTLAKQVAEWKNDPTHGGYDYPYAKSVGVIRKKALHRTGPIEPKTETLPVEEKKPVIKIEDVKQKIKPKSKYFFTASIIIAVMTVVGILSAIMSAYHTASAMQISGRSLLVGWITGTVMILFSATAFTAARFFFAEKGIAKIFGLIFAMLGVIIICYSMFSTLTVNYTNYTNVREEHEQESAQNSAELQSYNKQIALYEARLTQIDDEIAKVSADAEYWKTMSWKRYDELQSQVTALRTERNEVSRKLISIQENLPSAVAKAETESGTVYSFFSDIFGIEVKLLQFFMQSVPAMFFDIIAPFALTCSLYLRDRQKEKENDED